MSMSQPRPRRDTSTATLSSSVAAFTKSFVYAWAGVWYVMRTQRNARVHLGVAILVIALAAVLHLSPGEIALLVAMIALVIALEMLNTVVEAIVDLVTVDYHPLAKIAKDVAAGSVLVAAIGAACVGILVLGPHMLR